MVFVHELAGQAEGGGDGGGVGAPDQGVEADGVEAQHGGVGGDHGPVGVEGAGFVEVLEDGVGEFVEVTVHAGGAAGHAGFQQRGVVEVGGLEEELGDGGKRQFGGGFAGQDLQDTREGDLGVGVSAGQ